MKIVVADSSALILLTKIQVINIVVQVMEVYIPKSVEEETASSLLQLNFPDAKKIAQLIEDNKIKVTQVAKKQKLDFALGRGEEDAILLFKKIGADLLLCDDGKALRVCRHLNIPFIISPRLVVELYRKNKLGIKEATEALEQLREFGRYTSDIIARAFLDLKEDS